MQEIYASARSVVAAIDLHREEAERITELVNRIDVKLDVDVQRLDVYELLAGTRTQSALQAFSKQ